MYIYACFVFCFYSIGHDCHAYLVFVPVALVLKAGAVDGEGPVTGLKLHTGSIGARSVKSLRALPMRALDAH